MYKKLVTLILVLALSGMASAESYWTNLGADTDWLNDLNWSNHTPYASDSTFVRFSQGGAVGPTISSTEVPHLARRLTYEVGSGPSLTSTMTGGTLRLYYAGTTSCYFRLPGGSSTGTAYFNMSGGNLSVDIDEDKYTKGSNGYVRVGAGYDAELNMSGDAEISAWDLIIAGAGRVDLRDNAKIKVLGDDAAEIQAFIAGGLLTAYGTADLVEVVVADDPNSPRPDITEIHTVITAAVPIISHDPIPASNSGVKYDISIDDDPILDWTPGIGAVSHDVYFGTDAAAVAAATTGSPEFIGNQDPNDIARSVYYPAGLLELDKTYYWRIDDVQEAGPTLKGNVWYFTIDGFLGIASAPVPASGSSVWYDTDDEPVLSWTVGGAASGTGATHDVYFGTDAVAVAAATTASPEFVGNQPLPSIERSVYHSAGSLDLGQTYYWRIDEVEDGFATLKGLVWNFTIYNYLEIDGFEAYEDSANPLSTAWIQADGATISLETADPYVRFTQSMKFEYDNTASPLESSASFAVDPSQKDWTRLGTKSLGLWFYGFVGNDASAPLYLTLEDSSANTSTVIYGDMADPEGVSYDNANIEVADWHEWRIDAQVFALAGVGMTDIKSLTIGLGDGATSTGTGAIWIDNVRLYEPLCFNGVGPAGGDVNNDCTVDIADFAIMAKNWLTLGWWPGI